MTAVPPGFLLMESLDKPMGAIAPLYIRMTDEGLAVLGFQVDVQHCNPRGSCHGGIWATLADVLMGLNVGFATGLSGPTVSMTVDYLGAARVGQWVEGSARMLRQTPNLGFIDCLFTADGEPALRASATVRRKWAPYKDFNGLLAKAATAPEG